MNIKEFNQELIQELLLNIQPSYYKNVDRDSFSIYFSYSKQLVNTN